MLEVNEMYLDRLSEAVYSLLNGRPAAPVELPPDHPQDELRQLARLCEQPDCGIWNTFGRNLFRCARQPRFHDRKGEA